MQPQAIEIDELGNAFQALSSHEYTPDQMKLLARFLNQYALDYHADEVKRIFKDKIKVADALKTMHDYASHYQNEEDVYEEFQDEVDYLLIAINQNEEGISI
jgi:hypothetical protein